MNSGALGRGGASSTTRNLCSGELKSLAGLLNSRLRRWCTGEVAGVLGSCLGGEEGAGGDAGGSLGENGGLEGALEGGKGDTGGLEGGKGELGTAGDASGDSTESESGKRDGDSGIKSTLSLTCSTESGVV